MTQLLAHLNDWRGEAGGTHHQGANDDVAALIQRLEHELAAIEAARANLKSQIHEAKKMRRGAKCYIVGLNDQSLAGSSLAVEHADASLTRRLGYTPPLSLACILLSSA